MGQLTEAGAEAFGARATENLAKLAPSKTTTLVLGGGVILLGIGWLAFIFYKESRRRHVQTPSLPPPPPPV